MQKVKGYFTLYSLALPFWINLALVTKPKKLIPKCQFQGSATRLIIKVPLIPDF